MAGASEGKTNDDADRSMSVEHFECFTRFRRLVDIRFETFLEREGVTTLSLINAIRRVRDRCGGADEQASAKDADDEDGFDLIESSASLLLECLSAADDYDVFVEYAAEELQLGDPPGKRAEAK